MKKSLILLFGITLLIFSTVEAQASNQATKDVSAYLQGSHIRVSDAKARLTASGFEVLSVYKSVKQGRTIVFTCPALKREATKPNRANIAVMRLFIDNKEKTISVNNPVYFGRAYMQNDYNHSVFLAVKSKIEAVFPGLMPSKDKMAYEKLPYFHLSVGMPFYEDVHIIDMGSNAELLDKLKKYKKGKDLAFELRISDDTTLIGYGIGRGTQRFVKKIGRANAGLLPWPVVVSDETVTILKPEYYISLNYPLLEAEDLNKILSVSRDIIKDLSKPFK